MHLLIIDNGTKHLEQLQSLCAGKGAHQITTMSAEQFGVELAGTDLDGYDAVVLSGSYNHSIVFDQPYFLHETELISTTTKPILGICAGFELICYAFGCQLHELTERVEGGRKATPTDAGAKIFQGTDPILVTEAHRWAVDELPRELVVLARSDTGIEAVKHKTRPIWGLQFHPEDFVYSSDGSMVFANIIDNFKT